MGTLLFVAVGTDEGGSTSADICDQRQVPNKRKNFIWGKLIGR